MHTRSLAFTLLLACTHLVGAQEWTQALQSGSPQLEGGTASRLCPDDGIVSIGYYRNEALFDNITLPSGFPEQNVCFVVKHSATGVVEWAHAITNTDPDDWVVGHGLDVDSEGNIIVGGTAIDTILVDGEYATHVANQQGTEAMFVIKFSPSGDVIWSVDAESTAFGSELMALTVDPADNIWFGGPISSAASKVFKLNGETGVEMVETGVIQGQVRQIDTDANGNVYLRGQSTSAFTLNGVTCPLNNVMGGNTTNWTAKLNSSAVAQWFHVPDQGHLGFSPWHLVNQAVTADGRCYAEANDNMRINGDTVSMGANSKGLYMLSSTGTPIWWKRLNRTGMLEIEDMSTDPFGNSWITGTATGIIDLLDTVVNHTGFFAFQFGADGHLIQRVFGPPVLHTYTVDAKAGEAIFAGEYSSDISFGDHAIEDNLRGLFVARYSFPADVNVADHQALPSFTAYPVPAQDHLHLAGLRNISCTVDILSVDGQLLHHLERFRPAQDVIDLSGLPAGAMLVRVRHTEGEASIRITRIR